MQHNTKLRIAEFIIAGLLLDTIENVISIKLSTGAIITKEVLFTTFLVVIPFSIIAEVVIDHPNFWPRIIATYHKLIKR